MDLLDYTFVDIFAGMPTLLENVESSNTNLGKGIKFVASSQNHIEITKVI
jgi:hypothetical protein